MQQLIDRRRNKQEKIDRFQSAHRATTTADGHLSTQIGTEKRTRARARTHLANRPGRVLLQGKECVVASLFLNEVRQVHFSVVNAQLFGERRVRRIDAVLEEWPHFRLPLWMLILLA